MARQETTRRRVSNLVGRFEELAGASPSRISDSSLPPTSPQSTHPASYHEAKAFQQHDRRSFSLSSIPSSLQARLDKEFKRNKQLRDECEQLRTRCYENDAILTALSQQLEEGTNVRQTLHVQTAGLQAKVDRLADKLARRDQVQRTTYERRIAAVANERDILVSKLRIAEEAVEQAKAADERALVASRQAQALRSQLLELKTDVAARKGGRESVSDQEIFGMMSTLNHMIQNWTVSTFRKVKIDPREVRCRFAKVSELQDAKILRKLYSAFDTSIKIFALQATVIHLLMPIFDTHFFGLPKDLYGLEAAARAMQSTTSTFNEWRATTAELLHNGGIELNARCQTAHEEALSGLVKQVCSAMSVLTGANISETQERTLITVVEHAVSLSHMFDHQRATYQCLLPNGDDSEFLDFDIGTMENLMDGQDKEGFAREIRCVVFPMLVKIGGERGESVETNNVLMKAKVLCVEEDDSDDDSIC